MNYYLNKNKKISKHSTLFLRYLSSYVLVLLLPLVIVGMLFYSYFFNLFEMEVAKNNHNQLKSVQAELDTNINELGKLVFQIINNPRLTSYRMLNNPLDTKDGINDLRNYIITNNFISDIYLYIPANDMIYSSTRTYKLTQFFDTHFIYQDWDSNSFRDFFDQNKKSKLQYTIRASETIVHDGAPEKYVTILFPFIDRMVFFVINENSFLKTNAANSSIILSNNEQEIIAANHTGSVIDFSVASLSQLIEESQSSVIQLNNSDYFVSMDFSETTGWTYYSLLPVDFAMQKVIQAKIIFIYGIAIVLLLGIITIIFVMRLNYNPIKKLKKFAETQYGHSANTKNELEAVKLTIDSFAKTSKVLNEKVEESHYAIREYLMMNLLKGSYINIEKFNSLGKEEGLNFSHNFFTVAIIFCKSKNPDVSIERSSIINLVESGLPSNIDGYGKDTFDSQKIVFIFSHNGEDFGNLKEYLFSVQKSISQDSTSLVNIGIGNSYDSIGQLGKSYIEAATAIDYRLIKGNNSVILFEEAIPDNGFIMSYPMQELKSLEIAILNADTMSIPTIISKLINIMRENNLSLFNARCLSFDIISTVIKAMCTINREFLYSDNEFPDVLALNEFETLNELGDVVENVSLDICAYIKNNKKVYLKNFMNELITYIDNNYTDYNFSIQSMSLNFDMSPSNLGHYFKQQTGKSLIQYVNSLRINKAKELLMATDCTVNEIIIKLGYCDTSSFIRKFKKIVGTTPGNFRKSFVSSNNNN